MAYFTSRLQLTIRYVYTELLQCRPEVVGYAQKLLDFCGGSNTVRKTDTAEAHLWHDKTTRTVAACFTAHMPRSCIAPSSKFTRGDRQMEVGVRLTPLTAHALSISMVTNPTQLTDGRLQAESGGDQETGSGASLQSFQPRCDCSERVSSSRPIDRQVNICIPSQH